MMQGLSRVSRWAMIGLMAVSCGFQPPIIGKPAAVVPTSAMGKSFTGPLPALTPSQADLARRLYDHLHHLTVTIGERNVWKAGSLAATVEFLNGQWRRQGYQVTEQPFEAGKYQLQNLEVSLPGAHRADEILVVGAHYDTVADCPGANDNGSGVSALLEISRVLAGQRFDRTIRFVAFANEEDEMGDDVPMGSQVYARQARARGERIVGMLSLETMGYYDDAAGSQKYPFPLSLFFPKRANFIGFVGNTASRRLLDHALHSFRQHADFPSEGMAAPSFFSDIARSDQSSFWEEGYPGLMVTDTADFRYAHYHTATDTIDRVDVGRLARVTEGLANAVADLASTIPRQPLASRM